MKTPTREVALPIIGLIAGTRALLGAGIGLLVAEKLDRSRRLTVGRALLAIGIATTIPLVATVVRGRRGEFPRSAP